ncbi:MAG: transcription antitermination factor NusB [Oscillospiraceae bacterium]
MTRTNAREIAIHFAFELGFTRQSAEQLLGEFFNKDTFALLGEEEPLYAEFPNEKQKDYIEGLVRGVYDHRLELDGYIEKYAKGWRFSRIDRVATAIMRVAMYEIMYMPEIPDGAAVNEAVEISKGYEDPEAVAFINGILGTFVREELPQERL